MKIEIPDSYFNSEELENTPKRIKKFMMELKSKHDFAFTTFLNPGYDEMVILKDIHFISFCSHHLLPFTGVAHIGYIPDEKICGISKLARVVDMYSSKPQLQEKMTNEIITFIQARLKPKGTMIVIEAKHMCISERGIQKHKASMVTSAIAGVFKNKESRDEFMRLIK